MPLSTPPSVPRPSGWGAAALLTPLFVGGGKGGNGVGAGWSVGSEGLRRDCGGIEEPLGMDRERHPCAALQHAIMVQTPFICRSVPAAESEGLTGGKGGSVVVRAGRETSGRVAAKLPSAPFPNSFVMSWL